MISERALGEFKDYDASPDTWKVSIRLDGYSGSVLKLTLTNGFDLEYFGNNEDLYDPIKSSRLSFSFLILTDDEKDLADAIQQADFLQYGVVVYKNLDVFWRGWIYPEETSKEISYNSPVEISAGDGLALLENVPDQALTASINQVVQIMMINDSTGNRRYALDMGKLYDNGDVVLSTTLDWVSIWKSDTYNRMYEYFATTENELTKSYLGILDFFLRITCARIFQANGQYYVVPIPTYQGRLDIDFSNYTWDETNNEIDFSNNTSLSVGSSITEILKGSNYRGQARVNETTYNIENTNTNNYYVFTIGVTDFESGDTYVESTNEPGLYTYSAYTRSYYVFTVTSSSYSVGSEYTNNSSTFTVVSLFSESGINYLVTERTAGTNQPNASGSLVKSTGGGPSLYSYSDYTRSYYVFTVTSSSYSVGSEYTNNSSTFTVVSLFSESGINYLVTERTAGTNQPNASGSLVKSTVFTIVNIFIEGSSEYLVTERTAGTNEPLSSGTLTKSAGSGPASYVYSAVTTQRSILDFEILEKNPNESFFTEKIESLPIVSYNAYIDAIYRKSVMRIGGVNQIENNPVNTLNYDYGVFLHREEQNYYDSMTNGQDFSSGWTAGTNTSIVGSSTKIRVTVTALTALANAYTQVTGLQGSTDYYLQGELIGRSATAGDSWKIGWNTSNNAATATYSSVSPTTSDYYYFSMKFNTPVSGNIYVFIAGAGAGGEWVDFANIRLYEADKINRPLEQMMLDNINNHLYQPRRLYDIAFYSKESFLQPFDWGNEFVIPHSYTFNAYSRTINGSFITVGYNQYPNWKASTNISIGSNGESDNQVYITFGSPTTTVYGTETTETMLKGGFEISFNLGFESIVTANSTLSIGLYEEGTTTPSGLNDIPYSFLLSWTTSSQSLNVYSDSSQVYSDSGVTFESDQKFIIRYDFYNIYFIYDGTTVYTVPFDLPDKLKLIVNMEGGYLGLESTEIKGDNVTNIPRFK